MTHRELDAQSVARLCNGNTEAFEWIQMGRLYCHAIDDLIDETVPKGDRMEAATQVCRIGAMALRLYTHPFFLKNHQALTSVMMVNTINYRDSVLWENSTVEWQRQFSDWGRHGWTDVALVVGELCGGYDAISNESLEIRTTSYVNHHDKRGAVK